MNYPLKISTLLLIAALVGEFIIYILKRLLVSEKSRFSFDVSGIVERVALPAVILAGGWYNALIPVIVIIRALYFASGSFGGIANIINREEPAVEFQKIRLKSELSISLLASPALGILFGILAKII